MKKTKVKKSAILVLATAIAVASLFQMNTFAQESKSNSQEIEKLKQEQEQAEKDAKELEDAKKKLQSSLGDMNSDMYNVSNSISETQNQLAEKEQEIADAEEQLKQAEEQSEKQYDDMKKRIQFIYEKGNDSAWVMLLEAGSVSEFLSRVQYITQVGDYDRDMLTTYQETQQAIASNKEVLVQQKEELVATQKELEDKEANLNQMIASKQDELATTNGKQQKTEEQAQEYANRIAAMEEYERQLEAKKAAEDAKRLEELKGKEEEINVGPMEASVSDETLLAAIIHCESRGEPYEGQLAVGRVVLNRVVSSSFPNTIAGVIYQPGQFSPVASGRLATVLEENDINESCRTAAREVLEGKCDLTYLFFHVYNESKDSLDKGIVIGHHYFA